MTTPTDYTRYRDYSQFQADNPDTVINGSDLDADFDRIKTSLDTTKTSLATIRRDDGALKNGIVTVDALSADTLTLLALDANVRGEWDGAETYASGDVVEYGTPDVLADGTAGIGSLESLADLKAYTVPLGPTTLTTQYRTTAGDGGGGRWVWRSGNQSSNVSADTQSGIWAAPTSASTGASGAWQRQFVGALNAKWFGAKGDSSTDDTTALQALFTMSAGTQTSGGNAFIPPGTYKVTSALTVPDYTMVSGTPSDIPTIYTASATANVLNMGVLCGLEWVQIASSVTRTAGYYINGTGNSLLVENCQFSGYYICISVGTLAGSPVVFPQVRNCVFRTPSTAAGSGAIQFINFANAVLTDCSATGYYGATQPTFGARFQQGDTAVVSNNNFTGHGQALLMDPPAGYGTYAVKFSNNLWDSAQTIAGGVTVSSAKLAPVSTGYIRDTTFTGDWFGLSQSESGCSVQPVSSGIVDGLTFTGCHFPGNTIDGLTLYGASIKNVVVSGGYASGNARYGIGIYAGVTRVIIDGFRAGNVASRGGNLYGINIENASACDYYTIQNCNLEGNTTAALFDGGTGVNKLICNNLGTSVVAGTSYVSNFNVAGTSTLSGALTYGGKTFANTVTGNASGSLVSSDSPTLVTPNLGTPSAVVLTNGTGLPISTGVSGLGTSVAAALSINVGSSGAIVTNGGALGTPSSGTLTNATGLPLATGVTGTLGLSNGGTGTDLSATGGTSRVLKQTSVGGSITVAQLAASDLSNSTTGSNKVVLDTSPTIQTALYVQGVSGSDSFRVYATDNTKFLVAKPETATDTAQLFYWNGAAAATLYMGGTISIDVLKYAGTTLSSGVAGTGKMVLDTAPILNGMASIIADNSSAYALDIRGRAADNISVLAFKSNDDATEYCKLQVGSSGATFSGKTFTAGSGLAISSGQTLQLGNAYVAGAPAATGYVTLKDSGGTTYKVLVST